MTLPCKDCITLSICKTQKGQWGGILAKCTLINDYILGRKKKERIAPLDMSYYTMNLDKDRYQEFIQFMGIELDGKN